jgi:hypothetical protein
MSDTNEAQDRLTPQEMQRWLSEEIADLIKAMQLRVTEASALVNSYAAGEISAEEAEKRLAQYNWRWTEALPGTSASTGLTDQQILAAVDSAAEQQTGIFRRRYSATYRSGPKMPSR